MFMKLYTLFSKCVFGQHLKVFNTRVPKFSQPMFTNSSRRNLTISILWSFLWLWPYLTEQKMTNSMVVTRRLPELMPPPLFYHV
uniref:Plastid glycerol-3-phosphate acyltransferase n=1 Tax=Rhizophora mucronata TaxID=61149 RepID=A0A2P2J9E8_RHIMU